MELTGTIVEVFETVQVKDTFKKRECVIRIEEDSKYPQEILCQTTQDKTSLLDSFMGGEKVKANINLRGKSYEKKDGGKGWFNSVEIWKIEEVK